MAVNTFVFFCPCCEQELQVAGNAYVRIVYKTTDPERQHLPLGMPLNSPTMTEQAWRFEESCSSGSPTQQVKPSQAPAAHAGNAGVFCEADPEVEVVIVDDRDDDARDSKSLSGAVVYGSGSQTSQIVPTELVASGSENTAFLDHGSDLLIEEKSEPREANIDSVVAAADVASTAFNMDFGDVASEASNACMRPRSSLWSKARPSSRPT